MPKKMIFPDKLFVTGYEKDSALHFYGKRKLEELDDSDGEKVAIYNLVDIKILRRSVKLSHK